MLGKNKNLIDMQVEDMGYGIQYRVFWVYKPTDYEEKKDVWELISERGRDIGIPWLCLGDFNDILYNYEKEGGNIRAVRKIKRFKMMIENCRLNDLGFKG